MTVRHHRRCVVVFVRSSHRTQLVRIVEFNRHGKAIRTIRRRLRTDRKQWLTVGRKVRYVHVTLA
jgi:hypothetical protein